MDALEPAPTLRMCGRGVWTSYHAGRDGALVLRAPCRMGAVSSTVSAKEPNPGIHLSRRHLLAASGALLATTLLGCGRGDTARRRLAPVSVSRDRIIRTDVGLRPFRPSGFVVRAEALGDKLLVHNYGHGGGGITLSWGSAQLALLEVQKSGRAGPAAVLGCGAVGLATARLLQDRGFPVTIYARDLPPRTTSDVAGASWYPSLVVDPAHRTPGFERQLEQAARFSYRYFQGLVGERYGVHWREQFFLADEAPAGRPMEYPFLADLSPELRTLSASEHPFASPHVIAESKMFIEPPAYLRALLRDFRLTGGRVRVREFGGAAEVAALPEPIVVNCTGLGSRELFQDGDLVPVKGQLSVLLPQPEVDYAIVTKDVHMFPRRDGIILGGTREFGVETLEPNPAAERWILESHARIFDSMRPHSRA